MKIDIKVNIIKKKIIMFVDQILIKEEICKINGVIFCALNEMSVRKFAERVGIRL